MTPAPLFGDMAGGPDDGKAWWLTTSDGVRVRMGAWGFDAPKGTILLFPGRTEYIEKYGITAKDFLDHGYATVAMDWRGQGLADRLTGDRVKGHVLHFRDYQTDVGAMLQAVEDLGLPKPYMLIGHSMGGCIGLRALHSGLPVQAAAFSAPMWGILMPQGVAPLAPTITKVGTALGLGTRLIPSARQDDYVVAEPFEDNTLTRDPEMFERMRQHLSAHPELGLGGPTFRWLHEALREMEALMAAPAPDLPCLCYLGTNERIVEPDNIRKRMATWPKGTLTVVPNAEHEVLMEVPETRHRVATEICAFFDQHL